jgi:hypothetical protein
MAATYKIYLNEHYMVEASLTERSGHLLGEIETDTEDLVILLDFCQQSVDKTLENMNIKSQTKPDRSLN